jgi:hypothetical protein
MAVASVSSNYVGRKKDISILQYPNALLVGTQTVLPGFGKNTRFCAGAQKLVQRYAITLLTNISSQEKYPDFGTNLLYTLKAGISPMDQLKASQIFELASYEVVTVMKIYQTNHPEMPLDERLARATLTSLTLIGGLAAFEVTLITEAGDSLEFIIPLPK